MSEGHELLSPEWQKSEREFRDKLKALLDQIDAHRTRERRELLANEERFERLERITAELVEGRAGDREEIRKLADRVDALTSAINKVLAERR